MMVGNGLREWARFKVVLDKRGRAYLRESNGAMDAHAGSVSKERLQLENGEEYNDKWAKIEQSQRAKSDQ
jgi:hypothetical protein